ncbi:MAG: thymidylate synthase [Bacilli bacterium]|nr:thymidylate synthase [Bacilli bacterium]
MKAYLDLIEKVLSQGKKKHNRTGIDTISVSGAVFEHDMSEGFPLLTSKKMGYKTIFAELEFFIKGLSDKKWLQERNCHIWDEWCNPQKVPYGNDEETKKKMKEERDLGSIYGVQWRNFDFDAGGFDQLKYVVNEIKNNPESRRILCSAWNPNQMDEMALPPCHVLWQVLINTTDNTMDLIWYQRSCDLMLGIPYNIASYAMLLELLCLESGKYKAGKLIGFFADLHIYENHLEQAKIQIERNTHPLPTVKVNNFKSIFDWEYTDSVIENYEHEDKLVMEVAV